MDDRGDDDRGVGQDHGEGEAHRDAVDDDLVCGSAQALDAPQRPDRPGDGEPRVAREHGGRHEAHPAAGTHRAPGDVVVRHDDGQPQQGRTDHEVGSLSHQQQAGAQDRRTGQGLDDGLDHLVEEGDAGQLQALTDDGECGEEQPQGDDVLDAAAPQPQDVSQQEGGGTHGLDVDGGAGGAPVNPQVDAAQDAGGDGHEAPADDVGGAGHEGQAGRGVAQGGEEGPGGAGGDRPLQGDDGPQEADEHEGPVERRQLGPVDGGRQVEAQEGGVESHEDAGGAQGQGHQARRHPGGQRPAEAAGPVVGGGRLDLRACRRCRLVRLHGLTVSNSAGNTRMHTNRKFIDDTAPRHL